ncbi:Peptidase, partial [Oryctes borbonicus]
MEIDTISELLNELSNIHFPSGPIYQEVERKKALLETDELACIYHLSESHVPGLRYKAIYRFEKNLKNESDSKYIGINKSNIDFNCKDENTKKNISDMLRKVEEMPKEWVIIQLTPEFNAKGNFETLDGTFYTDALYVTMFHCGKNQPKPFYIKIDAPLDRINGKVIQIRQEMESIIVDNRKSFTNIKMDDKKADHFNSHVDKHIYSKARYVINNRLKNLVKDIQDIWLGGWRCLFAGKLVDEHENDISEKLQTLLLNYQMNEVPEKIKCILHCLIRSSNHLKIAQIKQMIQFCFPNNRELHINLSKSIYELGLMNNFSQKRRHPVILVVDEKLDALPWEMLDVLQDHPVSRMPSLHFTYALFKEHEDSIVDGVKVGVDCQKGNYIINPGLDLKRMEARLQNFFNYWTPNWNGLVGVKPSREEFEELLLNCDIFSYNGHGNGSQFFSSDRIQRLR